VAAALLGLNLDPSETPASRLGRMIAAVGTYGVALARHLAALVPAVTASILVGSSPLGISCNGKQTNGHSPGWASSLLVITCLLSSGSSEFRNASTFYGVVHQQGAREHE
jgi:hypothetical protein